MLIHHCNTIDSWFNSPNRAAKEVPHASTTEAHPIEASKAEEDSKVETDIPLPVEVAEIDHKDGDASSRTYLRDAAGRYDKPSSTILAFPPDFRSRSHPGSFEFIPVLAPIL